MKTQITQPQWVSLKPETRFKIAEMFGLVKDTGAVVEDGYVVTDGYSHTQLAKITLEGLQDKLKSKEKDFIVLFLELVESIENPNKVKEPVVQEPIKKEPIIVDLNEVFKTEVKLTNNNKRNGKKNK